MVWPTSGLQDCAHKVKNSWVSEVPHILHINFRPFNKAAEKWLMYTVCWQLPSHTHAHMHYIMSGSPWTSWCTGCGQLVSRKNESFTTSFEQEAKAESMNVEEERIKHHFLRTGRLDSRVCQVWLLSTLGTALIFDFCSDFSKDIFQAEAKRSQKQCVNSNELLKISTETSCYDSHGTVQWSGFGWI